MKGVQLVKNPTAEISIGSLMELVICGYFKSKNTPLLQDDYFVGRIMLLIWSNIVMIGLLFVGSKYYENEKRKDAQIEVRIARQKEELDRLTDLQKAMALAKVTCWSLLC